MTQRFLVHSQGQACHHHHSFRNIHQPPKHSLHISPFPQPLAATGPPPGSAGLPVLDVSYTRNRITVPFCVWLLYVAGRQGLSCTLSHLPLLHLRFRLSKPSVCGSTTFGSSVHRPMGSAPLGCEQRRGLERSPAGVGADVRLRFSGVDTWERACWVACRTF